MLFALMLFVLTNVMLSDDPHDKKGFQWLLLLIIIAITNDMNGEQVI